jgi:dihydrodipicolinate synthase/N-acetylneuraminate lyase
VVVGAVTAAQEDTARYPQVILGTCCVPWNDDYSLAEDVFRRSIRALADGGLRDLYLFGTAGEGHAVSDALFEQITRVFVEEASARDIPPMVGLISLSLPTVIERIAGAAALGVRRFQISLPSWGTLTDAEVSVFFRETCGRFPDYQFLHYNLPRSGRLLSGRDYAALAAAHPNLVATKYGGTDVRMVGDLLAQAPQLRHFFTEQGYAAGSALGVPGFLVSLASTNLRRARAYFDAGVRRDAAALAALQWELAGLHRELVAAMDPGAHMDGAYDKLFSRLHVPDFPLRLLPPYAGASAAAFERFAAALRERYPAWAPDQP